MYVDSHCHLNLLDLSKLGTDLAGVLAQAKSNQVNQVLSVATDLDQHGSLMEIAQKFSMVNISAGIHPDHCSEVFRSEGLLQELSNAVECTEVVAIGETGLDYYHISKHLEPELVLYKNMQQWLFALQIQLAQTSGKPLIIHSRMAPKDTIDLLISEGNYKVAGVMHCFTESWDLAKKALDLGFYISFSGIITFKNKVTELLEIVKKVPLDRILIETDSPYLAPVPFRGSQNQPKLVPYVAAKIAELKNITINQVAAITCANYENLFNVKLK